jgi:hypothetical protein
LPYLTVDGVKIPQSVSIARFVAKKFKLAGADELEQAKADAIVDTIVDLQTAYYSKVFKAPEGAERDAAKKTFLTEEGPSHLAKIEKLIGLYGSNGFSVGSSLKWSDLFIWDVTSIVKSLDANLLDKYPGILGVRKSVETNAHVAEYLKNRPETAF